MKIVNYATYTGSQDKVAALRPAHREYVTQLLAEGRLVAGGPFTDGSGALFIYETESLAAAEAIVAADPYQVGGRVRELPAQPLGGRQGEPGPDPRSAVTTSRRHAVRRQHPHQRATQIPRRPLPGMLSQVVWHPRQAFPAFLEVPAVPKTRPYWRPTVLRSSAIRTSVPRIRRRLTGRSPAGEQAPGTRHVVSEAAMREEFFSRSFGLRLIKRARRTR
jgi:uncharacterized protein